MFNNNICYIQTVLHTWRIQQQTGLMKFQYSWALYSQWTGKQTSKQTYNITKQIKMRFFKNQASVYGYLEETVLNTGQLKKAFHRRYLNRELRDISNQLMRKPQGRISRQKEKHMQRPSSRKYLSGSKNSREASMVRTSIGRAWYDMRQVICPLSRESGFCPLKCWEKPLEGF